MAELEIIELMMSDRVDGHVIKTCKLTFSEQIDCMYSLIVKTFWTNLQRFMEHDIPPKKKWPCYKNDWYKVLVHVKFFEHRHIPFLLIESDAETGYFFCPTLIGYEMKYENMKDMEPMMNLFKNKQFCENHIINLMLLYCFERKNWSSWCFILFASS